MGYNLYWKFKSMIMVSAEFNKSHHFSYVAADFPIFVPGPKTS
jgi:hypothetical protein